MGRVMNYIWNNRIKMKIIPGCAVIRDSLNNAKTQNYSSDICIIQLF